MSPVSLPPSPLCVSVPAGVARLTAVVPSVRVCPRRCRPSHRRRLLCACLSLLVLPVSPPSSPLPLCVSVPAGVARSPPSSPLRVSVPTGLARLTAVVPSVRVCPRRCRPSHRRRPLCACLSPLVSPVSPPSSPLRVSVPAGVARLTAVIPSARVCPHWSRPSHRRRPLCPVPPVVDVDQPVVEVVAAGRLTAILTCHFRGQPATVVWTLDGRPLAVDVAGGRLLTSHVTHLDTGIIESRLSILLVTAADFGTYVCSGQNQLDTANGSVVLRGEGAGDGATCTAFDVINYTICDRLIYDSGRCYIVNYKRKSQIQKLSIGSTYTASLIGWKPKVGR